ncbi:hypothetical protein CPC08DRAFT_793465 [Agrocybe pediades]|nr:hypothetical protein CPC08DRAFT_793465 [Agrocybe pediades]
MAASERSLSRGREAFQSTGRGGLGNIRQTSKSRDARPNTGPDDFSVTRGREPINANQVFSTGRGGAGNLRSPSRGPAAGNPSIDVREEEVIREYVAANEGAIRSSGRGGLGNFSDRSRSRDPASPSAVHSRSRSRDPGTPIRFSTGRGGAGNIQSGDGHIAEIIDEDERRVHRTPNEGIHSTGRGGAANLTSAHEPNIEQPPHRATEFESTGRGGAGNIISDRSRSRQRV